MILGEDVANNFSVNIGQAEVAPGITVGEAFVVKAEQVKNRRLQVMKVHPVFRGVIAVVVCISVGDARFDSSTC